MVPWAVEDPGLLSLQWTTCFPEARGLEGVSDGQVLEPESTLAIAVFS